MNIEIKTLIKAICQEENEVLLRFHLNQLKKDKPDLIDYLDKNSYYHTDQSIKIKLQEIIKTIEG
jgi:hypothetical protein